jgi:hypothetical protein
MGVSKITFAFLLCLFGCIHGVYSNGVIDAVLSENDCKFLKNLQVILCFVLTSCFTCIVVDLH